jgi:D-alanine-D-alanine ligase
MKKIAVVAGGNSGEYEVSLRSGKMIVRSLDPDLFEPYFIVIRGSRWAVHLDDEELEMDKNDFSFTRNGEKVRFDAVYLMIHGTPGEDGKIQGYFHLVNMPFVGPGISCCVLTSAKSLAKELVAPHGIPVAKSRLLLRGSRPDWDALVAELSLPLFIKPNSGGSSVATHKVYKAEELSAAFEDACKHDIEVLAEEFIAGTEVTCGIFHDGEKLVCLPITEIRPHRDFFDYNAKYLGESDEITPAPLSAELTERIHRLTEKVYRLVHADSLVRVDFIIRDGVPYFMEVNTIPGFSEASIVPQQLRAAGFDITQVLTTLVNRVLPS